MHNGPQFECVQPPLSNTRSKTEGLYGSNILLPTFPC